MDIHALRVWGVAASAALMTAALVAAWRVPGRAAAGAAAGRPEPAPVAFLVRFRGDGPIARAQALGAGGEKAEASRRVAAQLQRQDALRGLCFERFSRAGAALVLRVCDAPQGAQRAQMQRQWLNRLNAMPAVAYVDPDTTAAAD